MANFNPTAKAEIWEGNEQLATFLVEPGTTVQVDRNNKSRRTLSATFTEGVLLDPPNTTVVPSLANDLFSPLGNEVKMFYGMRYDDGTIEYIQEGVFGNDELEIDDTGADLVINLTGSDRMAEVIKSGFISTVTIPPNTNVGTAIMTLMANAVVGFPWQFNFTPTDHVTPLTPLVYTPADDAGTAGMELASNCGCALFFDPNGVLTFAPIPDPSQASTIWTYSEFQASLMDELKRTLNRTATPNYIIVDGTGPGVSAPIRGVAIDDNPLSQTYIGGKYGRVRSYTTTDLVATQAQANDAANGKLLLRMGAFEAIEFKAVPKPDHDVDDVIAATRARAGIIAARYVLDSFTLGFGRAGILDAIGRTVAGN